MKHHCWQYLLISWFWTDRSKAMAQCASLITISTFARPTQNPWPRFSLPYSSFVQDAAGFQVDFCCLCRHNGGCGLLNNAVLRGHGRKKKVEILTSCFARHLLLPLLLSKSDSQLDGRRKNIWKTHRALPNETNIMAPERKYSMNQPPMLSSWIYLFTFSV